jgi:hypothetical protein
MADVLTRNNVNVTGPAGCQPMVFATGSASNRN